MIELDCTPISNIVTAIIYNEIAKVLELNFTNTYETKRVFTFFNPTSIYKSFKDLENKILREIPIPVTALSMGIHILAIINIK